MKNHVNLTLITHFTLLVKMITVMMKHFIEFTPKGDDQMMLSRRLWASLSISETILN